MAGSLRSDGSLFCLKRSDERLQDFMLYELTVRSCPLLSPGDVAKRAVAWAGEGSTCGDLLGCWRTEFGTFGRVLLLRGFATAERVAAERKRALLNQGPLDGATS